MGIDSFKDTISGIDGVTRIVSSKTDGSMMSVKTLFSNGDVVIYCLGNGYGWNKKKEDYVVILDIVNNVSKVVPYSLFKKYKNNIEGVLVERVDLSKCCLSNNDRLTDTLIAVMSTFNSDLRSIYSTSEVLNVASFVHDISKEAKVISIEAITDGIYSVSVRGILSGNCIC